MPDEKDKFSPLISVFFILFSSYFGSDFYFWVKNIQTLPSGKDPNCQKRQTNFAVCLEPVGFGVVLNVFFCLGRSILVSDYGPNNNNCRSFFFRLGCYFLIKVNPITQKRVKFCRSYLFYSLCKMVCNHCKQL